MRKFEPFEQVIVRNFENEVWKADTFSHYRESVLLPFACGGGVYRCCLPYEDNEYLLGTTEEPAPQQPEFKLGDKVEMRDFDSQDWKRGTFVIASEHNARYPFNVIPDESDEVVCFAQCRHVEKAGSEEQIDTTFFGPDLSAAIAATGRTHGFNLVARLNTAGVLTEQRVEILRAWAEKKPEQDNVFNEWRYWFKAGVTVGLNRDPFPTETNLSYWIHALDMGLIDAMVDQAFRIP